VYSTVALMWNRKSQCGNSCRPINLPLCLVWKRRFHTSFLAIHSCLPASIFGQKFSSARNQMLFIDQYSAVSNDLFLTCSTVFPKLRYRDIVAFRTKIWMNVFGHWLTANLAFPAVTWKLLFDHFHCPCHAINNFQGQSASIIITFEFFDKFVSSRTPIIVFGWGRKSCACFRNNIPFFRPSRYFLWSNDFDNQQHFVLNILWLIVCHWWAGIFVNKFPHFGETIMMCIVQGRNEIRWGPGQERSLPPPCSDLRSFGSKCTVLKKCAYNIVRTFWPPAVIRRPGDCAPFPPLVASPVLCNKNRKNFRK